MPLAALRLINPPGHPRKKPFPRYATGEASKNPTRKRAKPKPGGKAVHKKRAAARTTRRKRDAHGRFLKKGRPAKRRNPVSANPSHARKRRKRRRNPGEMTVYDPRFARAQKSSATRAKRKAAGRKAAKTRALKHAAAVRRGKKAAATRRKHKEIVLVARKKKHPKKAKKATTHRRKAKRSHASYVAAGKKAARTRKRHKAAKSAARKPSKRRAKRHVAKKAAPSRRRRKVRVVKKLSLTTRKGSRRRRKYGVTRRTKRGGVYKYGLKKLVRRNPAGAMVHALETAGVAYLGFVGVRALNVQIKALMDKSSAISSYSKFLAPAASFILATAVAPRFVKQPKLLEALQYGAVFALGDAILKAVVPTSGTITQSVIGLSDFGGFSEYIPLREYTPEPLQLGTDVQEAMALDEYVEGMGAEVEEALASPGLSADEMRGFQTGYAGGTLSKTVFSD